MAHTAADDLARAASFIDKGLASTDHRSNWGAQSFGEAKGDRIHLFDQLFDAHVQSCCRVKEARAIQVEAQTVLLGHRCYLVSVRYCQR